MVVRLAKVAIIVVKVLILYGPCIENIFPDHLY